MVMEEMNFDLDSEIERATQEAVEVLKRFIEDPKSKPSEKEKAIVVLRQWEDRCLSEEVMIEAIVKEKRKTMYRELKNFMQPEHYQNFLVALSTTGYDISEIEANANT